MIFDDINLCYLLGIICIDILIMVIMEFFKSIQRQILMIVLAFCIFCILAIGLKLYFVPCPECLEKYADGINNILLNLSYSYVAGYVIYWFTVIIPDKRDRDKVLPNLSNEVKSLWHPLQHVFNCYIGHSTTEYEKATKEAVSNAIRNSYNKEICDLEYKDNVHLLKIRLEEFKNKAFFLLHKDKYLSAEQYACLCEIINENYNPFSFFDMSSQIDIPNECKDMVSDQLWKIIEDYIKLRESFDIKDDLFLNSIFKSPNGSIFLKRKTANNSQNNK